MKKRIFALLICLALTISLFACTKESNSNVQDENVQDENVQKQISEDTPVTTEKPKNEITIKFMNGQTELGRLTVFEDEPVTGYEQFENVEGYIFEGWYKTPGFLEASFRDLSKDTFNQDTKLFGMFRSAQVTEDTREWFIVGEGASPALVTSAWAGSGVDENGKAMCRLEKTGNATNEYAITLDLFAGDKFQVIYDWQWEGQKGFGLMTDYDASQMESGGGLSGENEKSNVSVLVDGNYTITLTTDPDNAKLDTVSIVRNGDPAGEKAAAEEKTYVVGDSTSVVMKGSWVADWSENIELTYVDGTIFEGTKELEAGTELYFMIWDDGADTRIGMNSTAVVDADSQALLEEGAYNVKVAEAGTYTFTVDAAALTIKITK